MINFMLFALAAIGFTFIMVDSSILEPVREFIKNHVPSSFYKVWECYQCMGFWTGMVAGLVFLPITFSAVIMYGFAGSFLSSFAAVYINYLEAKSIIDINE